MATSSVELTASRPFPPRVGPKGSLIYRLVTTTDHKLIGIMYLVTCFAFFMVGGLMALLIRAELTTPGLAFLSNEQYNQLFTMHGTAMLLFYATPIVFGFANVVLPLQIGAPDVAFPRLNALSFWLFLFGALIALAGFITPGGAADFGWTAYTPLSDAIHSPGAGGDLWILGVAVGGLGTILGAVNMITTIVCMRAPGMVMFRMPIFTWNILVVSVLVLLVFPLLAAAAIGLEADRRLGAHLYDPANGGVLLWQHLFWFFGHPEVYVLALPFFGVVSEIFPVFSRKPIFGYTTLVFATLGIGALSIAVWAHHMYATGAVLLPFFSFMTFLIAVPTGIKFFNWIGTMWKGQLTFETPMLFSIGFLVTFLFGGLTGVLLAAPPIDFHVTDSYFVVAHFHYTLFGTIVFASFAGVYFWFPKIGHAAPVRRLPAHRRLHGAEHRVHGRRFHPRVVDAAVRLECVQELPLRRGCHGRRSVGLRQLPGVGHQLPAAAAQLHRAAPNPFRTSGIRAALSTHGRTHARRGARRALARHVTAVRFTPEHEPAAGDLRRNDPHIMQFQGRDPRIQSGSVGFVDLDRSAEHLRGAAHDNTPAADIVVVVRLEEHLVTHYRAKKLGALRCSKQDGTALGHEIDGEDLGPTVDHHHQPP